jgi:hypothetical protein
MSEPPTPEELRVFWEDFGPPEPWPEAAGTARRLTPGDAFVLDVPDVTPAVWGRGKEVVWPQGESLMIPGPTGVGKTTIAGQLVRGLLGLRDEVLGWPVELAEGRVLYLAMDRPAQTARALHRIFAEEDRAVLAERLRVWRGPPSKDLARHPEALLELALSVGASHVFLDSLKDAAIGLTDDETGSGYNRARQLALVEGVEVCELHHQRKGQAGAAPKHLEDVYGSTWLTAGAGSVLLLWGKAGDPIVDLHHLKQPADDVGPLRVIHDHGAGTSERWHAVDLVKLAQINPAITARFAACQLFEKDDPDRNEIERARRRLDKLADAGLLRRVEGSPGGAGGGTETTYGPAS